MNKLATAKVNRLEIIDHTPCKTCGGLGYFPNTFGATECPICHGAGYAGRSVIAWDSNVKVELDIQDEGRTLKVFLNEKKDS